MARRNSKGRFVKSSHKRRRKHVARKENPAKKRRRNPRPAGARAAIGYAVGKARVRRRKLNPRRSYSRRSNPRFSMNGIVSQMKAGAIGGAGGVLNSLILGFVGPKLPTTFSTGYALDGVRIVSAAALGAVGRKFAGNLGAKLGEGAMIVAFYQLLRDVAAQTVPSLPMGDYQEVTLQNPAALMGAYMDGGALSAPAPSEPSMMGAYMDGIDAQY